MASPAIDCGFSQLPDRQFDPANAAFTLWGPVTFDPATDNVLATGHPMAAYMWARFTVGVGGVMPNPLVAFNYYHTHPTGILPNSFKLIDNPIGPTVLDIIDAGSPIVYLWYQAFNTISTFTVDQVQDLIITPVAHNLEFGDAIRLTTTGTLPAPFGLGFTYYVVGPIITPTSFQAAVNLGGAPINITSNGVGTHSVWANRAGNDMMEGFIRRDQLGYLNDLMFFYQCGDLGGGHGGPGGGGVGAGGESIILELPRPTLKVRDPELASILRRARRAAATIENMTIAGASGNSEDGFAL